ECEVLALEKAELLARGAALKWASGIFCRPDQLAHLSHYRRRETQRNNSIQSRLKSSVQSYLEGVELGLSQLHVAGAELQHIQRSLTEAQQSWRGSAGSRHNLEEIENLAAEHLQLSVVIQSLPHIHAAPLLIGQTRKLVEEQQLLEAHVKLRDLESLQDEVLRRLEGAGPLARPCRGAQVDPEGLELVTGFFAGVQELSEQLADAIFSLARSAVTVARSDPVLLVSAVRIIEREELLDAEGRRAHAPPGRPKRWRAQFFRALEKGVCERLLPSAVSWEDLNPTELAKHLKGLQRRLLEELQSVSSVLAPCVPPHYELGGAVALMCHQAVARHLREALTRELPHPALYRLLHWLIIVYPSKELMAHPDLALGAETLELGPLVPPEMMEEQLNRYTRSVRACLSQWIHKALEVEYSDWLRDQEPEKDQDGFYLSGLQQIVMQMLLENVQLAAVLGESLEMRVRNAALCEMDNCLLG
ncbi:LOW QUALITY PROTEIN: exocyst complex component 3-like protein, partial [Gastrophryne carolinensis]